MFYGDNWVFTGVKKTQFLDAKHTCLDFFQGRNFAPPPCEISDLLYHKIAKNVKRGGITCKNRLFSNFAIPQNAQKCHNRGYNLQKMAFFWRFAIPQTKFFFAIPQWGGMGPPLTYMALSIQNDCRKNRKLRSLAHAVLPYWYTVTL